MQLILRSLLLLALVPGVIACHKSKAEPKPAASAAAAGSVVVNALSRQQTNPYVANRKKYVPRPMPSRVPIMSGPALAILPGKGVGPIRIGATVKTIERHMDLPCEVETPTLCRYIARAVDFELKNGVVERVVVHRMGRPAGKDKKGTDREFGIFHGGLLPDFQLLMKQEVIQEHLGAPLRKEMVKNPGAFRTMERDHYDGMIIEYDRYENDSMVLGGVIIEKGSAATLVNASEPSK